MTVGEARLDEIQALEGRLRRAHRMGCSDPGDPSRKTTYSESADAIDYLLSELRKAHESLADAWDLGVTHGHNADGRLIDKRDENPYIAVAGKGV